MNEISVFVFYKKMFIPGDVLEGKEILKVSCHSKICQSWGSRCRNFLEDDTKYPIVRSSISAVYVVWACRHTHIVTHTSYFETGEI